jgi:acyl-CoA synthetase (AMP-forming)/AMP-acid ligase II
MTTIASVIRTHAVNRPDAVSLLQDGAAVTYAELHARSNRVASALRAAGVGAGDRVAFLDKNSIEYFELLFGGAKLNAVSVAVNWRLTPSEIAYIVNDTQATVFVFGAEYADLVARIAGDLTTVETLLVVGDDARFASYAAWRDAGADVDPGIEAAGSDVAIQVYSSGTTGHPKGVMLSNDNLFSLLPTSSRAWGIDASAVNMVALPLFHIGGSGWAMVGLFNGCSSVIVREADPPGLIRLIGRYRITHAFLVPVLLQFMQAMPGAVDADYSSLKLVIYGASPISEQTLAGAVRLMRCKFAQAYGLTETTGAIVTLPPEDHAPDGPNRHRLRAAGKPHGNVELKIVSPDTGKEMPVGEPGEIWTRSRQNMVGYWRMDEATTATLTADGWLKTGDIGYFDSDGYLYIHDRLKDMIVSGGENVYPAEIENVLMMHASVADVAVIGIPSEKWGESPLAIIVPARGATIDEKEILAFARQHLAGFKIPAGVELRPEIPRNASGKVLKKVLRAPYWKGRGRRVN